MLSDGVARHVVGSWLSYQKTGFATVVKWNIRFIQIQENTLVALWCNESAVRRTRIPAVFCLARASNKWPPKASQFRCIFLPLKGAKKSAGGSHFFSIFGSRFWNRFWFPFLEPRFFPILNHYVPDPWFHFWEPFLVPKTGTQKSEQFCSKNRVQWNHFFG